MFGFPESLGFDYSSKYLCMTWCWWSLFDDWRTSERSNRNRVIGSTLGVKRCHGHVTAQQSSVMKKLILSWIKNNFVMVKNFVVDKKYFVMDKKKEFCHGWKRILSWMKKNFVMDEKEFCHGWKRILSWMKRNFVMAGVGHRTRPSGIQGLVCRGDYRATGVQSWK